MKRISWLKTVFALALAVQAQVVLASAPNIETWMRCERVTGYNQVNNCNSSARTDGTFRITHSDNKFIPSGTAATAYATLACATENGFAIRRGIARNEAPIVCSGEPLGPNYASISVCGPFEECINAPGF